MTIVRVDYEPTGEVRAPRRGEWFQGTNEAPTQARFDFHAQEFPILREVVTREVEEGES